MTDQSQDERLREFAFALLDEIEHPIGPAGRNADITILLPLLRAFAEEMRVDAYRAGLADAPGIEQRAIEETLDRLSAAEAGKRENHAFRVSVSAMLGWLNLPPQETIERDINALKARCDEAERGKREAEELAQERLAEAQRRAQEMETERGKALDWHLVAQRQAAELVRLQDEISWLKNLKEAK
jgi:hypothetical protein